MRQGQVVMACEDMTTHLAWTILLCCRTIWQRHAPLPSERRSKHTCGWRACRKTDSIANQLQQIEPK